MVPPPTPSFCVVHGWPLRRDGQGHLDAHGNLTSVNGTVVPEIEVDTTARLSASAAAARAIEAVASDPPANETGVAAPVSVVSLRAASTTLEIYRTWGQSFVDLSLLGVKPGDTVRLRFEFGMDGCTGIDGWYVDDVTVSARNADKEPANAAARSSSVVVLSRDRRGGAA